MAWSKKVWSVIKEDDFFVMRIGLLFGSFLSPFASLFLKPILYSILACVGTVPFFCLFNAVLASTRSRWADAWLSIGCFLSIGFNLFLGLEFMF